VDVNKYHSRQWLALGVSIDINMYVAGLFIIGIFIIKVIGKYPLRVIHSNYQVYFDMKPVTVENLKLLLVTSYSTLLVYALFVNNYENCARTVLYTFYKTFHFYKRRGLSAEIEKVQLLRTKQEQKRNLVLSL
jgi:hypothetical protein